MKKSLLLASALLCAASSFATSKDGLADAEDVKRSVDPTVYDDFEGYHLENRWILCHALDENFAEYIQSSVFITSVPMDGVVYISNAINGYAAIDKYDMVSGRFLGTITLTVDGATLDGSGPAAICNLMKDDYGHLVFHAYCASVGYATNSNGETVANGLNLYKVDNLETGVCSKVATLATPEEEWDKDVARVDYSSIYGDVTGENDKCIVMAAASNTNLSVFRWELEEGTTEWKGGFPDMNEDELPDVIWNIESIKTYPKGQTTWNTASSCAIVKSDPTLFYVDGNTTCPVLYDLNGNMIDGCGLYDSEQDEVVQNVPSEWLPVTATNGVCEFEIGGKNFIAYSNKQYNEAPYGDVRIIRATENFEWSEEAGAAMAWSSVPAINILKEDNAIKDGRRLTSIAVEKLTDENGKDGAYISIYRVGCSLSVYSIGEEGWQDPNGSGIEDIVVDEVEGAAKYYNLQGVEIANPENGLYIVKRGNKVSKELVK